MKSMPKDGRREKRTWSRGGWKGGGRAFNITQHFVSIPIYESGIAFKLLLF